MRPLEKIGVDHRTHPQSLGNLANLRLGNLGLAPRHILAHLGLGTLHGLIENVVEEHHISLAHGEPPSIGRGNFPKANMDTHIRDFGVAHAPDDLKNLLKVQLLLRSHHIDIACRSVVG